MLARQDGGGSASFSASAGEKRMCTLSSDLSPDQIINLALRAAHDAITETIERLRILDDLFSDLASVKPNSPATKGLRREIAARLFARYLTITADVPRRKRI